MIARRKDLWVLIVALVALTCLGCDFPRDPRGTLGKVQGGTMRVGIVDHVPWTRMEGGRPSGVEVELLKDFARGLDAEISFVPGTTPELLETARQGEVDVLVGGFTSTSPGVGEGKEAGVTGSYLTTRFVVGVSPGRVRRSVGTGGYVRRQTVHAQKSHEAEVAGLVLLVASLAQECDGTAVGIPDEAALHLAAIALAVLHRLVPVYPSGGVFRAPTMRERFERALARSEAGVEVKDAVSDNPLNGCFSSPKRDWCNEKRWEPRAGLIRHSPVPPARKEQK